MKVNNTNQVKLNSTNQVIARDGNIEAVVDDTEGKAPLLFLVALQCFLIVKQARTHRGTESYFLLMINYLYFNKFYILD